MAVYKDTDINDALISETFPAVAQAIIAEANEGTPDITAAFITENYPDIAASFVAQGEESGRTAGAEAEAARITSIDAVAMAGYEDIVATAKSDGKSTANDVKLAIFDAMQKNTASAATARATDGANLAAQTAELTGASGEVNTLSDDDKAVALMDEAAKNAKGA